MTQQLTRNQLREAAQILAQGGTVAFPTETVFGLGADATNPAAIQKIFDAKGRPSDNPLIVHVASIDQVGDVVSEFPVLAEQLMARFSPGPLTVVLPKRSHIPDSVTAGLPTVAVRIPALDLTRELLRLTSLPIAAPSANRSGKPSGTSWQSVLEDLDGRIDAIICENVDALGLESTVVDFSQSVPRLLRSGAVTQEMLVEILPNLQVELQGNADQVNSPGLRYKHYQPRAQVILIDRPGEIPSSDSALKIAYIGIDASPPALDLSLVQSCSDVSSYARLLYEFFREADRQGIHRLYCQRVDRKELGFALMDRLTRASHS